MRAIKVYQVRQDDFDDKGNLKPDSELMPLFAEQYKYKPGSDIEKHGKEYAYDNSTNKHPGRHYNIYEFNKGYDGPFDAPEAMRLVKGNSPVDSRGASALAWTRGRDNIFYDWNHRDNKISKEDFNKLSSDWNKVNKGKGKYELHSIVKGDKKESELEDKIRIKSFLDRTGRGKVSGVNTLRLPFIVEGDEDDIVSLNDVFDKNYDPGRDFKQEVQLKNIRVRTLPNGLVVPDDGTYGSYDRENGLKLENFANVVLTTFKYICSPDKYEFVRSIYNILKNLGSMYDINLDDESYRFFRLFSIYTDNFTQNYDAYVEALQKALDKNLLDDRCHDIINKLYEFTSSEPSSDFFRKHEACIPKADDTSLRIADMLISGENKITQEDVSYLVKMLNRAANGGNKFSNGNDKLLQLADDPDWDKWLDENFDYNDSMNISDRHMKTVLRDVSSDIKKRRTMSNIISGVSRRF